MIPQQPRRQEPAHPGVVGNRCADGYQIRHQPLVSGPVLAHHDRGARHRRMRHERGLHLAGFDPETAYLQLSVDPAEVLDGAVGPPRGEVAGPVHPVARLERAGHEPVRGQLGPVQVPARHLVTGEVQLAGNADGHRVALAVQQVRPDVAQRSADDRWGIGGHRRGQRVDGAFGRSVEVVASGVRYGRQLRPQRRVDRLATHHEDLRPVPVVREQSGREKLVQVRGGDVEEVDPAGRDVVDQRARVQPHRLTDQVQFVAVGHQQRTLQRRVEGEGRGQRDAQPAAAGGGHEAVAVIQHQVHRAVMFDHHPLGGTGRS